MRRLPFVVLMPACLALVALLALVTDAQEWSRPAVSRALPPPPCHAEPDVTWRLGSGDPIDPASTTLLATNGALHACAPAPGTLEIGLRGTTVAGIGARTVLVQGSERLLDVELLDEERTVHVAVPAAGALVLAFVNDAYAPPEDRNLWVSGLAFTPRAP